MCGCSMPNQLKVYNGTSWVNQTPQVWDGTAWVARSPLYHDGYEWRTAAPTPREFPTYITSTKGSYAGKDTAELAVPAGVRTNDFIVSLCVQQAGQSAPPRLAAPLGVMPTQFGLSSGIRLHLAAWPWEPSRGTKVAWDVYGSPNTVLMNLLYRYGNVRASAPVSGISEHQGVSAVPLMASQRYTALYVVLTVSSTLTGFAWPEGVTRRAEHLGAFGTEQVSILTADTPGGTASPGSLQLDATVHRAAVVLVTIPGQSDGNPTWILGDSNYSTLGQTTYLG